MNARIATAESPSDCLASVALCLLGAFLVSVAGCRGAAYRDVYQQKMASEIRILEDQLYEADYHNQVLIDELERAKARIVVPNDRRDRGTVPAQRPERPPAAPDRPPRTPRPTPTLPARPIPDTSGREPPEVAIPPAMDELQFPDVDLGEPVPPGGIDGPAEPPPGQIRLPDSVRKLYREEAAIPVTVRIHPGLSGGHRFDDAQESTGMHLAVEVIDQQGRLMDLEDLDVQGQLSVALLDPQREPADAQLGQWNFSDDELRAMIRPGSGNAQGSSRIHVYIAWNDKLPAGTHILAHVRLSTADTQLRAEAELSTADASVAQWNPRGGKPR